MRQECKQRLKAVIYLALVFTFCNCGLITNSNNAAATTLIAIVVITCLLIMVSPWFVVFVAIIKAQKKPLTRAAFDGEPIGLN